MNRVPVRAPSDMSNPVGMTGPIRVWCGAFVAALALYVATADRGPQWQDSGCQQLRIVTGHIENPRGLALVHPLQYFLGRAVIGLPINEPAFAITLVSAVAAAIAIANVAATVFLLTRHVPAALIAPAALMLSHTFWQHATYTESYALVAALLSAEWLLLVAFVQTRRAFLLPLLALANGLGIANHMLAILATPIDVAFIIWAVRARHVARRPVVVAALLWILGTLPYTLLVLSVAVESGDLTGTLHSALFGHYAEAVLNTHLGGGALLLTIGFAAYNFPGLTIPLAARAWTSRARPPTVISGTLGGELLVYFLFVARYTIVDQYMFYFPVYALLALFAGIGLAYICKTSAAGRRRFVLVAATVTALWTPLLYWGTARISAARGAFASLVGNKPYRDGYRTFFMPWGIGDAAAERLNRAVTELAGENGIILVTDTMMQVGIAYAQTVGRIPTAVEIAVIPTAGLPEHANEWEPRLQAVLQAGRPVVLVPRDRDNPQTCLPAARWSRVGDIYRLTALESAASNSSPTPE
jgi:hypothetical protein